MRLCVSVLVPEKRRYGLALLLSGCSLGLLSSDRISLDASPSPTTKRQAALTSDVVLPVRYVARLLTCTSSIS